MVRAGRGGGRKAAVINYADDNSDVSDSEDDQRNGSKRSYAEISSDEEEDPVPKKPKAAPKKKASVPGRVIYKEMSSGDESPDAGEMDPDDDSDYETSKPVAKKKSRPTPVKKKPAKKATKKAPKKAAPKKIALTPSRASGRATKQVNYGSESEEEEDDDEDEDYSSEEEEEVRAPPRKGGRGRPPKMAAKVVSKKRAAPQHPPVSEMVPIAIKKLNENPRKGSSLAAIKGYMAEEWGADIRQLAPKIKNFVINSVADGELIQRKGKGASGRFTLPGMKRKMKKRPKKIKEEELELDAVEYKPVRSARDEEREEEEKQKEIRRQQRKEEEIRRELEKASQPKKSVKKQTEWEVELIMAMKTVQNQTFYKVKFVGWKKPYWEPEENLTGCQEAIDNFLIEEKARMAEKEEKRKREEDDGLYEVARILEVKFPKGKSREFLIRWKGHGEEMDSWEPEDNLTCDQLIDRFMAKHEARLEASDKRLREAPKPVQRLQFAQSARNSKRNQGFRMTYEDMDD